MEFKDIICKALEPYNPYQIALFGSRANGKATKESDFDIMIWWKNRNFPKSKYESDEDFDNKMLNISYKLSSVLNAKVDLVVMRYVNKWQNNNSDRDNIFYENVKTEALYFKSVGGNELIDMSVKEGLYKT